ncbi:MAG: DUF1801 domain-containing protein [Acidimicrobiales bacterium]
MADEPKLLSGGNPQIPNGYGDEPVQAFLDAMPGWKQDVGRTVDRLVRSEVPDVALAVKWNTPFYGMEQGRYFLGFHCLTKYVKVTFFDGVDLAPQPPVCGKPERPRHLHVTEDDEIDEEQFRSWVRQAAELPGEKL